MNMNINIYNIRIIVQVKKTIHSRYTLTKTFRESRLGDDGAMHCQCVIGLAAALLSPNALVLDRR